MATNNPFCSTSVENVRRLCVGVNLPDTEVCRGATPWSWSESSTEETVVVLPSKSALSWSRFARGYIYLLSVYSVLLTTLEHKTTALKWPEL
ncbi:hypothetical protein PoB_001922500 [Plakobranchus ocellatus]|uniref:Uncharacterized protein n=1 Tax=Plakobranchus ocellatus TaxID=259542 RepID=A0AAV3ZB13_9GAST|nr:hypothetical protein PoB_001922500 [Plakobranchus ocellatus]